MQATQIPARVRFPFPFPDSLLVPFCLTTITLATKELPRLALASQFLLKPGWRPEHDKAGDPGSRQLSGAGGGGGAAESVRTLLSRVPPPPPRCHSPFAVATAGGSASRLDSPRLRRRRGESHGARARGFWGVSLAPLWPGPDPPPWRPKQQGPRGASGRSSWPPRGADRQGTARSRAAQALSSAAAAAAPAVGHPEQLQPRATHLGARTWPEPRAVSRSLAPERVPRAPPPGSPVLAPPEVRIRLCAARGKKSADSWQQNSCLEKLRDCLKLAKGPRLLLSSLLG